MKLSTALASTALVLFMNACGSVPQYEYPDEKRTEKLAMLVAYNEYKYRDHLQVAYIDDKATGYTRTADIPVLPGRKNPYWLAGV